MGKYSPSCHGNTKIKLFQYCPPKKENSGIILKKKKIKQNLHKQNFQLFKVMLIERLKYQHMQSFQPVKAEISAYAEFSSYWGRSIGLFKTNFHKTNKCLAASKIYIFLFHKCSGPSLLHSVLVKTHILLRWTKCCKVIFSWHHLILVLKKSNHIQL